MPRIHPVPLWEASVRPVSAWSRDLEVSGFTDRSLLALAGHVPPSEKKYYPECVSVAVVIGFNLV